MAKRVPDPLLERYLLGELPPDQHEDVRRRLDADPESARRIEAIRSSNHEILLLHPPRQVVAEIERRGGKVSRGRARSPLSILVPALLTGGVKWEPLGSTLTTRRCLFMDPWRCLWRYRQKTPMRS